MVNKALVIVSLTFLIAGGLIGWILGSLGHGHVVPNAAEKGPLMLGRYAQVKGKLELLAPAFLGTITALEFGEDSEVIVYSIYRMGRDYPSYTLPPVLGSYRVKGDRMDLLVEFFGTTYIFRGKLKNNTIVFYNGTVFKRGE